MVLVFDLDDTLYDEKTYVLSGFRAVARYLKEIYGLPEKTVYKKMAALENERGSIFDRVLEDYGICSRARIKECVRVYRHHEPRLFLNAEAKRCLRRFRREQLYIVTDGHKVVQLKKLKALGLWRQNGIKHAYRTNAYSQKFAKPHPHCFRLIAKLEHEKPENIVYVGDNPRKDFVIRKYGFKTIRLKQGHYADLVAAPGFEAHCEIDSLDELTPTLLKELGVK